MCICFMFYLSVLVLILALMVLTTRLVAFCTQKRLSSTEDGWSLRSMHFTTTSSAESEKHRRAKGQQSGWVVTGHDKEADTDTNFLVLFYTTNTTFYTVYYLIVQIL